MAAEIAFESFLFTIFPLDKPTCFVALFDCDGGCGCVSEFVVPLIDGSRRLMGLRPRGDNGLLPRGDVTAPT